MSMGEFEEPEHEIETTTLLSILKSCDEGILDDIRGTLQGFSRKDLDNRLMRLSIAVQTAAEAGTRVSKTVRIDLWLLNEEYTSRGIPPVLRNLPEPSDDDRDQIADAFAYDLGWIVAQYPKQRTYYPGWSTLLKQATFHGKARWISGRYPKKDFHWICRGLDLSDKQQRELHFVKKDGLRKEHERLKDTLGAVRNRVAMKYHDTARDPRHRASDPKATIARRIAIWYVGTLAQWKPQGTANLYEAYTGEKITRQAAAKVIAQVHRDIPESEPRRVTRRVRDDLL